MNRKEQIEQAAEKWTSENGAKGEFQTSLDVIQEVAFECGADWSDANPDDHAYQKKIQTLVWGEAKLENQLSKHKLALGRAMSVLNKASKDIGCIYFCASKEALADISKILGNEK